MPISIKFDSYTNKNKHKFDIKHDFGLAAL